MFNMVLQPLFCIQMRSAVQCSAVIDLMQIFHASLDRDWNPKANNKYVFSIRILCNTNFVFSCQKISNRPFKSEFFLLRIMAKRVW
jgi:hypothetical protein